MIRNISTRLRPQASGLRSLASLIGIAAIVAVIGLGLAGCVSIPLPYTTSTVRKPVYGAVPVGERTVERERTVPKPGTGVTETTGGEKATLKDASGRTIGTVETEQKTRYIPQEYDTETYTTKELIYNWQQTGYETVSVYTPIPGKTLDIKDAKPGFVGVVLSLIYAALFPITIPMDLAMASGYKNYPAQADDLLTTNHWIAFNKRNDRTYTSETESGSLGLLQDKPQTVLFGPFTFSVIKKRAKAVTYFNSGREHIHGDNDRAIADLTQAIKLSPNDALFYANRGTAYYYKEDYDQAIADYTQAIKLDPYEIELYVPLALAYQAKGMYDQAIEYLTTALRINPNDDRLYYWRGEVYLDKGMYDQAIADYNQAIQLDPSDQSYRDSLQSAQDAKAGNR